ncbi:MAG: MFS transporter, partial [Tepidiformaceae bacterium]
MKSPARAMASVAATGLALRQDPESHGGSRIAPEQVPGALRAFWMDGFFAAAQDAFILAYLPLLANALGANGSQIALLAASQSLGAMLALYPGAWTARRTNSRRWFVLFYAGILGRISLLLAALTVAIFGGQTALYLVITLFTVRAFLGNFVLPAWTSLAADIIPERLQAKYFASRNFAISAATLALTPIGGLILDHYGFPGGFVVALLVSLAFGIASTYAYSRLPDPPARHKAEQRPAARMRPGVVLRDRRFLMFMVATFALQFSTQIAGPFFNVYLKNGLGASNFLIGGIVTASALSGLLGQLFFGDLLARRGPLSVSRLAIVVLPLLPFMWVLITRPWMVFGINLIGGAMWAAFGLANFQYLLDITNEENREEYVAFFQTSIFLAMFAAPFIGGVIVDHFGYRPAFFIS